MAGGKGTRLASITKDEIPKPMVKINGFPILWWQLKCLKENGITDIILVTGYLGQVIEEYFGDGSEFGVKISYFRETMPLGTAGALYYARERIKDKYFLLVFGDVIFDIDIQRMENFHQKKHSSATLFVHPNSHPYDSDIIIADECDRIIALNSKNSHRDFWYKNLVNAGFYILDKSIFDSLQQDIKTDLEKNVLVPLIQGNQNIFAYSSPEYIKDVGTPERIGKGEIELKSGYVGQRNLKNKQRCIFLDRDGTINRQNGLVFKEEDLVLEDCAIEAIKLINQSGMLAIVITNQPVVARGLCEISDVVTIHNKLETLLGEQGAIVDDIVFCPHHPDKGFPEENPLYKIECNCRKPKTGMIDSSTEKFNVDISSSWLIGDTTMDLMTGKNAGLKTALVLTGEAGNDKKYPATPDIIANNLLEAVKMILNGDQQ
ncbi:MAG: HAD-IIIA family hydrolase [Bacteroidales bacterium]